MKRMLLIVVAAFAILSSVAAAKPQTATLVPSCNPCVQGSTVSFTGSGYEPGYVGIAIIGDAHTAAYADAGGNIAFTLSLAGLVPGSYEFVSYQFHGRNGGGYVQASLTLQIT